ncbi:hypothetical protein AA313_de0210147 [Arthrobotrys entomopaga]|nr:hypothetical protein AA313_de0210147 [Arthrobotrys entomopaga]
MKVLVLSATGCMAGGLVRALKDDPTHQLYAFTRNPDSDGAKSLKDAGVTVLKGDYKDKDSLSKAFSEAKPDAVFFTIFPDFTGGDGDLEQAQNVIDAVKRHGVKQVLHGSVARVGTQENFDRVYNKLGEDSYFKKYWIKKWAIQDLVRNSGASWTIIKPPVFIQNVVWPHYVNLMTPELPEKLIYKNAMDLNARQWWADGSDVGKFAAAAIRDPEKFHNKEITFGTELLTTGDVVDKLRKVSGKDVKQYEWPAEEWEASKSQFIHSTQHVMSEMGYDPEGGNPTEYGVELTPIDEWLENNKAGTWMA